MDENIKLWALSFLKIGVDVAGMPSEWLNKNSKYLCPEGGRITTQGFVRRTSDGLFRLTNIPFYPTMARVMTNGIYRVTKDGEFRMTMFPPFPKEGRITTENVQRVTFGGKIRLTNM
jgi:hypothetical protein